MHGFHIQHLSTEEPWYHRGLTDSQNVFSITRFCYIKVLFNIFCYNWVKGYHSLYQGFNSIEVRYINIPLYNWSYTHCKITVDRKKKKINDKFTRVLMSTLIHSGLPVLTHKANCISDKRCKNSFDPWCT